METSRGEWRYFVFTVVVFGLSSASFTFTKVVRVLIKYWRSQAIRIFRFIDDVFRGWGSYEETLTISNSVQEDLSNSGFVCNMVISQWVPGKIGEHLGFVVNLKEGTFSVTEKRKTKLMSKLEFISEVTQATARAIASLAGCIISMLLGVGPVACMCTRAMHADIREASSWDQLTSLSSETSAEIEFWLTSFDKYNGFPIWPTSPVVDVLIFSNASDFVWGGYLVKIGNNIAKGVLSEAEADSSSTWRELKATLYVLESFVASLTNKTVKHRSGNQAAPLV